MEQMQKPPWIERPFVNSNSPIFRGGTPNFVPGISSICNPHVKKARGIEHRCVRVVPIASMNMFAGEQEYMSNNYVYTGRKWRKTRLDLIRGAVMSGKN